VAGQRKEKVLTVPVESVFQRDDGEIVFVKKKWDPQQKVLSKKEMKEDKESWKRLFERRVIVTGLADNSRVEVISGLKLGEEVALEDPTLPADKKKDDSDD
jgi:multidrug efflux pump subunit AcrA (membrane-fusion protein)